MLSSNNGVKAVDESLYRVFCLSICLLVVWGAYYYYYISGVMESCL